MPVELETLKTYIEANLASSFIRPFKSPAGVLILFVQKKYSSFCLCIVYWGLNNLIIKNCYPLPLIGELLNGLDHAKRFTQLNLTNTNHWMRIWNGKKWKTAFQMRYGHFEYPVILFGLSNAPASFQSYVNKILVEKLDVFVTVYLNDILIYTKNASKSYVEAVR